MRILAWPGLTTSRQPYISELYTHLTELGTSVSDFTIGSAARGSFDVWHMHWPEMGLVNPNPVKAALQVTRLFAELHAAKARGVKLLWTAHNLKQHEHFHPRLEAFFWRTFTGLLDGWIALSPEGKALAQATFPRLRSKPSFVVPHGHFGNSYPNDVTRAEARQLLGLSGPVVGFVGQVRPYKNVPHLIRTFRALEGDVTLLVAGRVKTVELRADVEAAAAGDDRVKLHLKFIPEAEMARYVRAADVMVLPYRDVLNSGSALLALSFGVPVLVPERGAMRDLQRYASDAWVKTFRGELDVALLGDTLKWAQTPRPDLCLRALEWDHLARQTLKVYHHLCSAAPYPAPRFPAPSATRLTEPYGDEWNLLL